MTNRPVWYAGQHWLRGWLSRKKGLYYRIQPIHIGLFVESLKDAVSENDKACVSQNLRPGQALSVSNWSVQNRLVSRNGCDQSVWPTTRDLFTIYQLWVGWYFSFVKPATFWRRNDYMCQACGVTRYITNQRCLGATTFQEGRATKPTLLGPISLLCSSPSVSPFSSSFLHFLSFPR